MVNIFKVALEEHGQIENTELEIEYSYFLQLNQEQIDAVVAKADEENVKKMLFSETKMGGSPENGFTRVRCYIKPEGNVYELTTKKHAGDMGKLETNLTVDEVNYGGLVGLGESTVVRVRLFFPIKRPDGTVVTRKNGSELQWEVDLYADARGPGQADPNLVHPWVKIEMEVDKATLDDVIKYIPFEYDELLKADSQNLEDRAFIGKLYAHDYNVRGKWKDPISADPIVD